MTNDEAPLGKDFQQELEFPPVADPSFPISKLEERRNVVMGERGNEQGILPCRRYAGRLANRHILADETYGVGAALLAMLELAED